MFLVNQSTINANTAVGLTLDTGSNIMTNTGTLEDTGTGGLAVLNTTVNNVVGASVGKIVASGAGSHVELQGAYIEGGNLVTTSGGVIDATPNGSTLDGITTGVVTIQGNLKLPDSSGLTLVGTIDNTGTINMGSLGGNTDLRIGSQVVTLQGGGKLLMSSNGANLIFGNDARFHFINVNNTISGGGQIGTGTTMFLVNQSTINANTPVGLTLNTGSNRAAIS